MKIHLLLFVTLFIVACSNKVIYESIQSNNRMECGKLPQSQYEECMKKADKAYEEYKIEREEALEKQ